ncbi:hypothetical protein [uncultured Friedmanniella sp.]|uniref:hypothetical protein n=1 Tax=uncultured Friedmanniella sp. TaxID=335381 RepID=UPI0035C997A9
MIAVTGASGHADVSGVLPEDHQGLLPLVTSSTEPVLLLTPRHHTTAAREQAHVLVAAHPLARVCVLPLDHHPLTLVLIAQALKSSSAAADGWPDPSAAVQLARRHAARSHSLVWYRRVWGLEEPSPRADQLVAGLLRRTGYVRDLAADPALVPARPGSPVPLGATVHHVAGAPALLAGQLGAVTLVPVEVAVARAPYSTRSSVELTVLVTSTTRTCPQGRCGSCSAGLLDGLCPFCGHGPWRPASQAARAPTAEPVAQITLAAPTPSSTAAPVPAGVAGTRSSEGVPT